MMSDPTEQKVEYEYCQFCGKMAWGLKRTCYWYPHEIEYFICIDCQREIL